MAEEQTLGQAIDELVKSLGGLDENSQRIAVRAVCEHFNINFDTKAQSSPLEQAVIETKKTLNEDRKIMDIRKLKEEKRPRTVMQMACVVAYYLQEIAPDSERKNSINAEDLVKYFKQAAFKLPKFPRQVLPDAKFAGYFIHESKGSYKLSPVGYNLVAHSLPKNKS